MLALHQGLDNIRPNACSFGILGLVVHAFWSLKVPGLLAQRFSQSQDPNHGLQREPCPAEWNRKLFIGQPRPPKLAVQAPVFAADATSSWEDEAKPY